MSNYLTKSKLQNLLAKPTLMKRDKVLLILIYDDESVKPVSKIKQIGVELGLRECTKWNITAYLRNAKGYALLLKNGWHITLAGKQYLIDNKFIDEEKSILKNDISDLSKQISKIRDSNTKSFLQEAVSCLEHHLLKSAVVFSWVGAVAILHDHVISTHLSAFNKEALRRDHKWKNAKNADDLGKMKEHNFLELLEALSIIGNNVKQELQQCLKLRNACGHPNTLKIGERKVAAHIEILLLNVYSKF